MNNDIHVLHFSSLQVWIASCFAFKLQFVDVLAFMNKVDTSKDHDSSKVIIKGDLLKGVTDWHNEVCGALTKRFVEDHTPDFVKEIIKGENLEEPNDSGEISDSTMCDPFVLHVRLLLTASEMMISCLRLHDLSEDAVSAIKNWFTLFDQDEFDEFLQCCDNYDHWKGEIEHKKTSYEVALSGITVGSGGEGEFFDPGTLFIYLAHAVFMECYDPSFVLLGEKSRKETTSGQNRSKETSKWQEACGSLVKWRFPYDSFKGMTGTDTMEFPILSLLNPISPAIMTPTDSGRAPPVHLLHYYLFLKMKETLNRKLEDGGMVISEKDVYEFDVLDDMLVIHNDRTNVQMEKIAGREKYFKNAVVSRGIKNVVFGKGQQGFRIDRECNNDTFLMGRDSFAFIIAKIAKYRKEPKKGNWDELANPF